MNLSPELDNVQTDDVLETAFPFAADFSVDSLALQATPLHSLDNGTLASLEIVDASCDSIEVLADAATLKSSVASVQSRPRSSDLSETNDRRNTILVVDDEIVTRQILKHQLTAAGYRVIEACDGREALAIAFSTPVDLVLMDVSMPKLNGMQAIRLMRQAFTQAALPVVMMTSCEGRQQIIEAFENGANDYIAKPIDHQITLARIQAQLVLKKAQQALKESEERYALAAQGTNDGLWDWNLVTGQLYFSPRWCEMLGQTDPNWNPQGDQWLELVHHEDRRRVTSDLEAHLLGETKHFETEVRMLSAPNTFRWMLFRGLAVKDADGIACRIAGSLTDITEGKVADALTGLPNRTLFRDRLTRCVEQLSRNPARKFAVLYLDVDNFKLINDSIGHDTGDEFLVAFARRLDAGLRKSDAILARLGGDEFAIVIENIRGSGDAIAVAKRLHERLKAPFPVGGREILTRASIGIVIAADQNETAEQLLRKADTAMYHAKRQSTLPYCVFSQEMLVEQSTRLLLGSELRYAIRRDELNLVYQPLIDLRTRRTTGFEALLRWNHPVHGAVSPVDFIPIAESNGLIVDIGKWVLEQACLQAARWNHDNDQPVIVSVNVSIRQLASDGFVETVRNTIAASGLDPKLLKLEVTESLLMQNPDETITLLERLRSAGVTIAIDDFGTGYSSLSYLHRMPLDVLKIDRSFVSEMLQSQKHMAIIRTIVALAESLQLQIIAEGIETDNQLLQLQGLGCHLGQGYWFSKPVDAIKASAMLDRNW